MRTHVVYGSQYGFGKRYAQMIADALTEDGREVSLTEAGRYRVSADAVPEVLVFVSSNYAGHLTHIDVFQGAAAAYPEARLVLLTVGMSSAKREDRARELWATNLDEHLLARTETFHARGGIDYGRLTPKHRMMMAGVRAMIAAKPARSRHPEDQEMLDTYGTGLDAVSADNIAPVLSALKVS